MPDVGNLLLLPDPSSTETLVCGHDPASRSWSSRLRFPILTRESCSGLKRDRKAPAATGGGRSLTDHVRAWTEAKVTSGVPERDCVLPFLTNAPKSVECSRCDRCVHPVDRVQCTVTGCRLVFHKSCAEKVGLSKYKPFKCPQHVCYICRVNNNWRCVRCTIAAHTKCAPWPEDVIFLTNRPGRAVCWKHPIDWRLGKEHPDPTGDVEEAFSRLPVPYVDEEFKIDYILKDVMENKTEPAPYVHIKRNFYLVKRKRDGTDTGVGCTNCSSDSTCTNNCECRGLSVSCSKACCCSDMCRNRPFRKEKKIKVVKTKSCGWGVEALEALEMGDFVIEYIGEVIDDALCEQRLWDMKHRGVRNFYMCEVKKDFTIDATFKGNYSRFLNHSCDPNCQLEKWQVDGETRVGVFASRLIEAGEALTYNYRFEHFGVIDKCNCGTSKCQGFLGIRRKTNQVASSCWGCKRRRSTILTRNGFAGGPSVQVPLGRRDGQISSASNVRPNMVDTSFSLDEMARLFSSKGLSLDDLVILSGAHTIGSAHCNAFSERFQEGPKGNLVPLDRSIDKNYAMELIKQCPAGASAKVTVSNDPVTASLFDNQYYRNLLAGKGLFQSDSALVTNARTKGKIDVFSENQDEFFTRWGESFVKLTSIGVKTGDEGEIRQSCMNVNS